jgi:hypothetical protein
MEDNNNNNSLKDWLLVGVTILFMVASFCFTYIVLKDPVHETWNFGTTKFVPNSSTHAIEEFDRAKPPLPTVNVPKPSAEQKSIPKKGDTK